jgi:Glyoxalase/Bleomycin resistance protein/Dioxygenase superfamily
MTSAAAPDQIRLYQQPFPSGDYSFLQLAFVVDDLVAAARRWAEVHGVGPFFVFPRAKVDARYRGRPSPLEYQIAVSQAGPVQIELVHQHCDQPSVYRDIYARGQSGAHHLATVTDAFAATQAHYERLGYVAVTELHSGFGRVAYFDTTADLGLVTEVIESSPDFLRSLARTARVCAEWDGRDPVRILRSGGYDTPSETDSP